MFCKITVPQQGILIGQPFYVRRDMLFLSVNWHAGQLSLIGAHATMSMVPRSVDITTNYIGFKTVDELSFLSDLASDLENSELHRETTNNNFAVWNFITFTQLDRYAPFRQRRVKSV